MDNMTPSDTQPQGLFSPARFSPLVALVTVIVVAVAFSFAFTPLRTSQDEWWHLKAGKWITEQGRLPVNDIFTYTGENIPWHNHEWLSQVIFYKIFEHGEDTAIGGLRALITVKSLIVAATFALLAFAAFRRSRHWPAALLMTLLAAEISRRTIFPRPPIFSYIFFAATILALSEWKARRLNFRWLWALPFMTVLWANLHGMCLLGVIATAAFAGGELIENLLEWRRDRENGRIITRPLLLLGALTAAMALATCANPAGYHIWTLGGKFANDPILKQVIAEMLPPPSPFRKMIAAPGGMPEWTFVPGFATFWIVAMALVVLAAANRLRMKHAADYLLCGFFLYQALLHWRLLPLFAIAAAGPMAWLIAQLLGRLRDKTQSAASGALLCATAALGFVFVFAIGEPPPQTFFRRNLELLRGEATNDVDYPRPLMDFIIRTNFPDHMFSEINYCGYPMWRLSPEHHKMFTDNRFDLFGSRFYVEEATVVNGIEKSDAIINRGWNDILDQHGVNFIVISHGAPVNAKLRASGKWKLVYDYVAPRAPRTSGFNVWLRDDPKFADVAKRARENYETDYPGAPPLE